MAKAPSVWSCVSKIAPEHLKAVYGDFPQKLRQHLGDWLENQPWEYITGTDPFCTETAKSVLEKLIEELDRVASNCGSDARLILQWVDNFKNLSLCDPMQVILLFKTICKGEMELVLKEYPHLAMNFQARQEEIMFNYRCKKLKHKMKETLAAQQSLKAALEKLTFHGQVQDLAAVQKLWVIRIEESLKLLSTIQDQAYKIINIWKRRQQLAGNGAAFDENLLPLQERLEFIFGIYEDLIRIIRELGETGQRVLPPEKLDQISSGFTSLIKNSFVVEKQPPQVLKTQTKFQASVNFMLGSKILAGVSKLPTIRAHIITEKKAQDLFRAPSTEALNDSGEIENGRSVFEFTQATRTCGALLKNMLLKRIKRCERKGSESVTEEKCAVLFTAEILFSGSTHIIQAISLPVVVIVHGNQDNNAKATILWDNAFAEIGRCPFYVHEKVPWKKLCSALNMKFMSEVRTTQELTSVHFRFLAQKIFGDNGSYEDVKDCMVSWAQFNKEPLRERNFTFWQWFDGVVDLTKKYLQDYWSDGLIMGFVSKQYVHAILSRERSGTFLLRFSDSEIGGITIAHIVRGEDGTGQIQNIQPFTAKDLPILSLGDRVRDLKQLTHLYEKGEKDAVFEKYYKKVSTSGNGYKRARIVLMVAGDEKESKQSSSQMNDHVPMEKSEFCQTSPREILPFQSPNYSPNGSPIAHIANQPLLYNLPSGPTGLIHTVIPTLPEQPVFNPNTTYPALQYTYVENSSNNLWTSPPYLHDLESFQPTDTYTSGAVNHHLDDLMDIVYTDSSVSGLSSFN